MHRIYAFVIRHAKEFNGILSAEFNIEIDNFINEIVKNLISKMNRMYKIEIQRKKSILHIFLYFFVSYVINFLNKFFSIIAYPSIRYIKLSTFIISKHRGIAKFSYKIKYCCIKWYNIFRSSL